MIGRMITLLTSFLIVPLTIDYINSTRYGIWLTLSSIVAWMGIFDLGLGQGFRNRFSESIALHNSHLAKEYVSTTYFSVAGVSILLYIALLGFNYLVDWSAFLKVDSSYANELHDVFLVVGAFFCARMVVGLFCTLLTADQKPGLASLIIALGNVLTLLCVYILTRETEGSLLKLAFVYSGIPCLTILLVSIVFFSIMPRYRLLSPKITYVRLGLLKNILVLGTQFFLINICMIAVFQLSNIVISREIGPLEVTNYNVAHKYFNLLYVIMNIIINPFWSAFTEAFVQEDYEWMKKMISRLERLWLAAIICGLFMLLFAQHAYTIWLGSKVTIALSLNVCMYVFFVSMMIGNIYMFLINGIGTIRIQLLIYASFAIVSWPILVWSCRVFGICGVLVSPAALYAVQAIIGKIQLTKLMNNTATGLWMK